MLNLLDQLLGIAHLLGDAGCQRGESLGVQIAEGEVFKLNPHGMNTEALGDGRVDIQGLARNAFALLAAHGIDRAHVVQAIGELDQDDAQILRHRQQQLAEAFCLTLGPAHALDLADLGNAVYQLGNVLAELLRDFIFGYTGIFDNVMQDRCDQCCCIHAHFGEDARDRQRVKNVGLAGFALLALVFPCAELIGAADFPDLVFWKIGREDASERFHPELACDPLRAQCGANSLDDRKFHALSLTRRRLPTAVKGQNFHHGQVGSCGHVLRGRV